MGDVDWSKRSIGTARQFGDGEDNENTRIKRVAGGMYRSWLSAGKRPGISVSLL